MSQYNTFLNRNQPNDRKKRCCPKITFALIARYAIRSIISVGLGIALGAFTEWGERKLGMHDDNRLTEVSDCVSCAVTLLATYTVNALLNYCWPANPYHRNQPNARCCPKMTFALFFRFIIRWLIPLGLGIGLGVFTEWGERKLGMHDDNRLVEVSDCVSCFVTLLTTYTVNALLNCCWPTNPYQRTRFFQLPEQDIENNNNVNSIGFGI